jgi:crossover junction endodeoxyribonuclease RuvC
MIILGIDPGSRKAGYAVIRCQGRSLVYVDSGVMTFHHIDNFVDRLRPIYQDCELLIERFHPQAISVESLIYAKSVSSLAKLAQARGAMLAALSKESAVKIFEYSPTLIKSTVSGHGSSDKESVEKALSMIFGKKIYKSNDESDALAIAVCHALHLGPGFSVRPASRKSGSLKSAMSSHPKVKIACEGDLR